MRIDRKSLAMHARWITVFAAGTLIACAWYLAHASGEVHWPGGSSPPGLAFGIGAGLIMVFELLLWPRKALRRCRLGKARIWMRAHIWLGLLTVPLIFLHSGFQLGGALSTALTVLFAAVVLSGIVGLVMQQVIPKHMLETLPGETVHNQVETISARLAAEAESLVSSLCGTGLSEVPIEPARRRHAAGMQSPPDVVVVGARRKPAPILQHDLALAPVPGLDALRDEFEASVKPYLLRGQRSGSPLADREHAARRFDRMREELDPAAHATIGALQECCDQRRQFDRQSRLHWWLHSWLSIHLPLSVALIVLMLVHAYLALRYMTPRS